MKQETPHRLFSLIITIAVGLFLTTSYIRKHTTENAPCIEKNYGNEKKVRREFMIWQSLSSHLLSLK